MFMCLGLILYSTSGYVIAKASQRPKDIRTNFGAFWFRLSVQFEPTVAV
jgi:hypothetical protein